MNSIVVKNTIDELLVPFVYEDDNSPKTTNLLITLLQTYLDTVFQLGYLKSFSVKSISSSLREGRGIAIRVDCEFVGEGDVTLWTRDFIVRTNYFYDGDKTFITSYWDRLKGIKEQLNG